MRFVIVTGMSGAGKSSALKMLEDAGYFCVDNLPVPLIGKFARLAVDGSSSDGGSPNGSGRITKVALGIDIRSGQAFNELLEVLDAESKAGHPYEILFLDASTQVLVKRYKETRRSHPLSGNDRIDKGIEAEREKLQVLKEHADYIIDTSQLLIRELKAQIDDIFVSNKEYRNFFITVVSFGFKYGIPADADLVFDVRFLANPYYVPELKNKTGNDAEVRDFVMALDAAAVFLDKLEDMLAFLIPNYIIEGKNQLVVGIGCTGGKHRSVTLANALVERLTKLSYGIKADHRDIERDSMRKG